MRREADAAKLAVVARVGRFGSVSMAAKSLHLTPSAVSQQVRAVEEALGVRLFERRPHGMALTPAGRVVTERVREIESVLSRLHRDLDDLADGSRGRVSVGVFPSFASSHMPRVMKAFQVEHPDLRLDVRSARLAQLDAGLAAHQLDVALTWSYDGDDPRASGVELAPDPTVLLLPEGHRRAELAEVPLAALAGEKWVCRADGHPVTDVLHRAAASAGFSPEIVLAANDYQETQAMVAAGIGIALVPLLATFTRRSDVLVRRVSGDVPDRQLHVVRRLPSGDAPAVDAFIGVVARLLGPDGERV